MLWLRKTVLCHMSTAQRTRYIEKVITDIKCMAIFPVIAEMGLFRLS